MNNSTTEIFLISRIKIDACMRVCVCVCVCVHMCVHACEC